MALTAEQRARELLRQADIEINGTRPWDVQVYDARLYDRVFRGGTLALGESYMDGWWDVLDMAAFVYRFLRYTNPRDFFTIGKALPVVRSLILNLQSVRRAYHVGHVHYDIGNDLYQRMLDRTMMYSCGYWRRAANLEEAQMHKMDLICRKIGLRAGQTVLDVGCGWGGFARFAAHYYGARVVGTTVSHEQFMHAQENTHGLPVEIRLEDWRETTGIYDHIVSIGMFEHVGPKNYSAFMHKMRRSLAQNGMFLLHTIGTSKTALSGDPWIDRYIFPNGRLPSAAQITAAIDGRWGSHPTFVIEDWHNFGPDYELTLKAWFSNFNRAWPELEGAYTDRFYRMWRFYLLSSAGMFRARRLHVWQLVLSKKGVEKGYISIR